MNQVKTMLIAPPHFLYFNSVGIPQLTGYLKSKGRRVKQILADNLFYDYFMTEEHLRKGFSHLRTQVGKGLKEEIIDDIERYILPVHKSIIQGNSPNKDLASQILKKESQIIQSVLQAYTDFKTKNTRIGKDRFHLNHLIIKFGLRMCSLPYYPTVIDPMQGITMRYDPLKISDIEEAIKDAEENPLLSFYEEKIFPQLREYKPSLLGVQINHESQIIPAFTILAWVKRRLPQTKTILGGSLVSYLKDQVAEIDRLWDYFDFLGAGMGEYTLDALVECLETSADYKKVPNLLYRKDGTTQKTAFQKVDLNDLSLPHYDESKPKPIIPYFSSSGCYWARCKFCEYPYHHTEFGHYNSKSVNLVIEDLRQIKDKFDPHLIFFCDSDIQPGRLEELSDALIQEDLGLNLFVWIRAEKEFTSLEFCRKLKKAGIGAAWMGLEAGSQRMNDAMDKGIQVNDVEQIIRNFHEVGIIANLFSIVGLPGETREEALLTRDFFTRNGDFIKGDISISSFMLSTYCLISKHPERFGIKILPPEDHQYLYPILDYTIDKGLSAEEAADLRDIFRKEFNDSSYTEGKFFISTLE
ncbi:MAG: hypothetical protein BAJALOKI3v1_1110005 [Promethearchaeota archaeon]|nr:MAG: hypothetical protein BAJALOKI3v1_1110005 [Candidatus Lokiarchaeota archaeon]